MILRSGKSWRTVAQLVVLASASLARADWYTWVGTDPTAVGDSASWTNQSTGDPGLPGVTDNIAINIYNGVPSVVLDQNREYSTAQFEGIDFDLNAQTLKLYNLEAYETSLHGGSIDFSSLQVHDYGNALATTFTNVTGSITGGGVYDHARLDLVNSTITGGLVTYNGGTLNLTNTSFTGDYLQLAGGTIDASSTVTLGANLTPDVYNVSLATNTGVTTLNGTISAVGSAMGNYRDASAARTDSTLNISSTGHWTDTTATVNSLGFGGDFTLNIDGGSAEFANNVNIGEGNIDYTSTVGFDGKGLVIVDNNGSFSAQDVNLGGWSRYRLVGDTAQIASGSGDVIVRNGGTFTANSIFAIDQSGLNRGASSFYVDQGGVANVGQFLGGAINQNTSNAQDVTFVVQSGGRYTGNMVDMIGAPGKTVQATFNGSSTVVDVQHLRAFNGARIAANGVGNITTSEVKVGENFVTTTPATIRVQNSTLNFLNKTPGDTYNALWAVNGDIDLINTNLTVDPNQQLSIQVGAYGVSGSGRLTMTGVHFDGVGGLFSGIYDVNNGGSAITQVYDSTLNFHTTDGSGNLFRSTVGIGESGRGSASFSNTTLDAYRIRLGNATGGNGDVELYDSSLTAHSTESDANSPAGIVIGRQGAGTLEMFNSSLNSPRIYIGVDGVLKGDGSLNGDPLTAVGTTVENHGTIAPGHSPGKLTVNGDLLLTSTSVLEMEVDLSNPSSIDQIFTTGTATLGGIFRLKAYGTGTFDPNGSYTFLTATSFLGGFSSYEIDPAFGINASAFSFNGGTFGIHPQAVPEPASFLPLALGLLALRRRRRA